MEPGTQVVHNQLGKGMVMFDKKHCLQVDFVLYGKWNFTPEEWASGKVAPERLRGIHSLAGSAISDLEYELQQAVENGDLSEQEALRMFEQKVHPLEVRKRRTPDINRMHDLLLKHPKDPAVEDDFYKTLLGYITTIVKKHSKDGSTFSNIEDAISTSAMKIWRTLHKFDPARSSFARFVTVVTLSEIRRHLDAYQEGQVPLEAAEMLPSTEFPGAPLSADKQIMQRDFMRGLCAEDRELAQFLVDGMTQEEIAATLGVNQSTISRRIDSFRQRIKSPF